MDLGLKGKNVVVTGGSGGIGHGLVIEFAREGCNVVSASRDAATSEKLASGRGSIVNISSNSSLLGEAAAGVAHYGAAKGFINSLTKGLAWEWARQGIRVNNICPGWIVPHTAEDVGEGSFWNRFGFEQIGRPEDMERARREGTLFNMSSLPIPRLGRPEDIAYLALFLASDRSSYITGQLISVSGGAYMS